MIATPSRTRPLPSGFSLVEMLITIAIMGVLTGLVVTSVSSASRDASRMIAKQQASEVQSAVNAWASSSANMREPATSAFAGRLVSIESVRASYNAASTTSARFELIKSFLDDSIADHFTTYTTNTDKLQSEALVNSKQYLKLEDWAAGGASYPKVSLYSE
jgi:prepilin-type N-terminal cleavage/methylation domain-containing protein